MVADLSTCGQFQQYRSKIEILVEIPVISYRDSNGAQTMDFQGKSWKIEKKSSDHGRETVQKLHKPIKMIYYHLLSFRKATEAIPRV